MLDQSILKVQSLADSMNAGSVIKPSSLRKKRGLVFELSLTSLIDAFSILVIFLLVNFNATEKEMNISAQMKLPSAQSVQTIKAGPVVSFENGHYFIDSKEVSLSNLSRKLYELRKAIVGDDDKVIAHLIIQADKKVDYASLNPIILAGSQAGFQQFNFAVLQGERAP